MQLVRNFHLLHIHIRSKVLTLSRKVKVFATGKSCQPQCKNTGLAINVQLRKTHLICRDIDPALVERQEGNT